MPQEAARKAEFPHPFPLGREFEFRPLLPLRGLRDHEEALGVRRPLSQDPLVAAQMQAEILVAGSKVAERPSAAGQTGFGLVHQRQPSPNRIRVGRQQRVAGEHAF